MKTNLLAWLSCLLLLGGCVANYPKDIAIVSINTVDYREQAELQAPPIPGSFKSNDPYRDFLLALLEAKGKKPIKPGDIAVYFREQETNQSFKNAKVKKPLFRIEFTSRENLHEFSVSKNFPVSIVPYFCSRPKAVADLGGPIVFLEGLEVGGIPLRYDIDQSKRSGIFSYYAFLNVFFSAKQLSSYESFDLRTSPEDICFQLKGGFAGRGFESNVVVIPKANIIKALEQMPPGLH